VPPSTRDVYLDVATRTAIRQRKAMDRKRHHRRSTTTKRTSSIHPDSTTDMMIDNDNDNDTIEDAEVSQQLGQTQNQLQHIGTLDSIEVIQIIIIISKNNNELITNINDNDLVGTRPTSIIIVINTFLYLRLFIKIIFVLFLRLYFFFSLLSSSSTSIND
jgi:hypothetical protein